jgi:polysaccharide export outer membrane protein
MYMPRRLTQRMGHSNGNPLLRRLVRLWLLASMASATVTTQAQTLPDYRLQPGDQMQVSVWGEPELDRQVILRPDGKFSFPLAGEIAAAGRTVMDIQTEMTQKLLTYIPEVVVTVAVTGLEGNRVYVIGQVNNPGTFIMNPQISVLQALSLAGGTTPFAALNDIIIVRGRGADQEVLRFGYSNVSRGRDLEQNIQLESGDVVIVP